MVQSLALIIRCHGEIPFVPRDRRNSGLPIPLVSKLDRKFGLKPDLRLKILTLAELNNVCRGVPELNNFVNVVMKYYNEQWMGDFSESLMKKTGFIPKTPEDIVNEIFFSNHSNPAIEELKKKLLNKDNIKLTEIIEYYIDKRYTNDSNLPGIGLFKLYESDNLSKEVKSEISKRVEFFDRKLKTSGELWRSEIISIIKDLDIEELFLIDLTCDTYTYMDPIDDPEDITKWIISKGYRGGKNKSKKSKKTNKKSKKSNKKSNNKSSKKKGKKGIKKYYKGGEWVNKNDINNNESCGICNRLFQATPGLAIYKTDCGHFFHNDCLYNKCNTNRNNWYCPICRARIDENQCMDVWAFKNKILDERLLVNDGIREIYVNQADINDEEDINDQE